ncbi:MAG: alpha-glucan family phosphorylase [Candidatus Dormibacteria bacterium]
MEDLRQLALDLTWTWEPRIQRLFRTLDAGIWEETNHNPVAVLRALGTAGVEQAMQRADVRQAHAAAMEVAAASRSRHGGSADPDGPERIGYFSLEFGLTDCLPIYSGGLGILAADHLKAASDLRLPVIGVGLFYRQGFGRQRINEAGEQVEQYLYNHPQLLPLEIVRGDDGDPLQVSAPLGDAEVHVKVWRVKIGEVPLFLLDTAIESNPAEYRAICDRLYAADPEQRLRQEIVLGIAGVRALRAMGLEPSVCHLNEGHSWLAAIELVRPRLDDHGGSLVAALEDSPTGLVFTTHTPVAAGSDYFDPDMVRRYLTAYLERMGCDVDSLLNLGRVTPGDDTEMLCTTVAALREAHRVVGVSQLHGAVSRRLWSRVWPDREESDVPIGAITNGVHMPTWVAPAIAELLADHVDPHWFDLDPEHPAWQGVENISDEELWEVHETQRRRLVVLAQTRSNSPGMLRTDILTVGFSRRFAQYKRANLLLHDPGRLARLASAAGREVQFIYAGKAHPADDAGKQILQEVVTFSRGEPQVSFVEDYNMEVARILVQGADVWLNTPRRLLEASGTSGMKAGANGVLNLSLADGWWDEGYNPEIGWSVTSVANLDNPQIDDEADLEQLFWLLETRVVPTFYERDEAGVPRGWVKMMRASIRACATRFAARRMVLQYYRELYLPLARRAGVAEVAGRA